MQAVTGQYKRSGLMRSCGWLWWQFVTLGCWLVVATTSADELAKQIDAGEPEAKSPPELSLTSLFHPVDRFDYDGTTATTHWLDESPPRLLVRRDKTWMQVDLDSGKESKFTEQATLTKQLATLDGVEEKQAATIISHSISKLKRINDPLLVRVDKSIAVVSTTMPAKRLAQDATQWGNATLDPTGRRVAYTADGDLFLVDMAGGRSMRLTQDNSETLLDGVLDWTYQEEIFGRGNFRGFWFSPDGQSLAMLRIDTSGVQPFVLGSSDAPRGQASSTRYPKAGDPIPHASLVLWDLSRFDQGIVPSPKLIEQSTEANQRIITGVWWHTHRRRLLYTVSDRVQSWRELRYLDVVIPGSSGDSPMRLLREESPAWVEPPAEPGYLADGSLIWRSELPTGSYRLYRISADGSTVFPISPEDLAVRDFYIPADGSAALVTGDQQSRTVAQHLYRIDAAMTDAGDAVCRFQQLTTKPGWHQVSPSPDGKYYVDTYSTAAMPPQVSLFSSLSSSEKEISLATTQLRVGKPLNAPEFVRIKVADGLDIPAMIVRPRDNSQNKDTNNTKPLAVVIETYGGPQAPVVSDRWAGTQALYRELLARNGIATVVVDNRSSAGRSLADTWSIHKRFGHIELQDLSSAVDWLKQQPWVDDSRIAIRGWSYGGYLTLYAMTHSDAFAAGIAGGSVTDFLEYDAFYTERYMGLPSENPDGYRQTDLTAIADKLQGRLLLIHGEVDDNVHPLGTLRMTKALQTAGKQFDLMIYPSSAHGIHQPAQVWHMVNLTHGFLLESLQPK